MHKVVSDYTNVVESSSIKVFVRARPLENLETPTSSNFIEIKPGEDEKFISIKDPDESRQKYGEVNFNFDRVFWTECEQQEIFDAVCKPQVDHVMNGLNSCCFAYGQTGSGKTYTMFGGDGDIRGMIPRSVEYLFERVTEKSEKNEIVIFSTFLEIYNDQIRDLGKAYLVSNGMESNSSTALYEKTSDIFESLEQKRNNSYFAPAFRKNTYKSTSLTKMPSNPKNNGTLETIKEVQDEYKEIHYDIYEDAEGNVFVKDISTISVTSAEEVFSVMQQGLKLRATHETKMNTVSSRSHCVFSLTVLQRDSRTGDAIKGTINLVDLAGSERVKKSESVGSRLREALHINTSLTALGKVIMALDPSSENTHIPYRDSKLTRILQNTLSGNSYTTLLATIHPCPAYFEECLSTLQFANRCRNVRNHPRVNYIGETEDKDKKIKRLLEEINQLRVKLNMYEGRGSGGGGKGGGLTPAVLVSVLQKLGMKAELGLNGEMIVDGKVMSTEALGLGDDVFNGNTHEGDDVLNNTRFRELTKEVLIYKSRIKSQKEMIEKQQSVNEELSSKLSSLLTHIHTSQNEYKIMVSQYERSLQVLKSTMVTDYEKKLKEVVEHNQYLMHQQHQQIENTTKNTIEMSTSSMGLKSSKSTEYMTKYEYISRIQDAMKSRDEEIALYKSQYENYIQDKNFEVQHMKQDFESSKEKQKSLVKSCETEIFRLYNYIITLEKVLMKAESCLLISNSTLPTTSTSLDNMTTNQAFTMTHSIATSLLKRQKDRDTPPRSPMSSSAYVTKIKDLTLKSIESPISRPKSALSTTCKRSVSLSAFGAPLRSNIDRSGTTNTLINIGAFQRNHRLSRIVETLTAIKIKTQQGLSVPLDSNLGPEVRDDGGVLSRNMTTSNLRSTARPQSANYFRSPL